MHLRDLSNALVISLASAGLRHKLSKLQLRAPGYPKGPPCIQRGPQKEKKKKRNQRKRKKERKRSKVRAENRFNYPPLEFTNFIDYPPPLEIGQAEDNRSNYPPRIYELHRLPPPLEIGPENRFNYPPRILNLRTSSTTPSKSGRKIASTTPLESRIYELHRLPPLEIGPENRSNYPPPSNFLFLSFPPFSSLGPHTGLIRPCPWLNVSLLVYLLVWLTRPKMTEKDTLAARKARNHTT